MVDSALLHPGDADQGSAEAVRVAADLLDQLAGTLTGMEDLPDYLDRVVAAVMRPDAIS